MENHSMPPELKDFLKKIIILDIGLFLVAGVMALFIKLYFAAILFGLGILCSVVGAYLGNANPYDPKNPRISHSNPYERPSAERLRARILYFVKHSVPFYSFENVLLFAGLIAILFGLLFLFS